MNWYIEQQRKPSHPFTMNIFVQIQNNVHRINELQQLT